MRWVTDETIVGAALLSLASGVLTYQGIVNIGDPNPPALPAATGVEETIGATPVLGVGLAVGLVLVVLGARRFEP